MMKKIEGYIQPSKLDGLKDALIAAGITGMTVYPVQGFGRQLGYRSGEPPSPQAKFLDKMKVEIVVDEDDVDKIVQIIIDLARNGAVGAGKVFVLPVEDAVRIGTGEVGTGAIH
jgi:nitrogen regulatory protein P-II 1